MNGAHYQSSGFSAYPFFIFDNGRESAARSVVTGDVKQEALCS